MSKHLINDLPELVGANIISEETAESIRNYYKSRSASPQNRLLIIFGILGAILMGLGIILIIAHNWDDFSRTAKTILSFVPLLTGQLLCVFVLLRKSDSVAWRESTAAFLFFAVGASISLISQIYNISGDLSAFILTWMLLCFPLMYIMNSSLASLLYVAGITAYAVNRSYWSFPDETSYLYWLLLLLALPHYYSLNRKNPKGNFTIVHNWIVPLSVIVALGTLSGKFDELMYIAYMSLFALLCITGNSKFFVHQKLRNNSFMVLGSLGTLSLLLSLSFDWFWDDLYRKSFYDGMLRSPEFIAASLLSMAAIVLLVLVYRKKSFSQFDPIEISFILFIIIFIVGMPVIAVTLINILIFLLGLEKIRAGARANNLGTLNYGLLIITALVTCRFFDSNMSFAVRGILFVAVGAGFFVANYLMIRKRKTIEALQ
ncbi:MAG TPA: DUF2157 domain-containing protein [Chitinophagales bacterium]|nr:DUF2157 domain-containing protein [Chitinophagales bacterium]